MDTAFGFFLGIGVMVFLCYVGSGIYNYLNNKSNNELPEPEFDDEDEPEFIPCSKCDGHPACEDFGCAIELGLGRMVKKDRTKDWEQ